MSNDDVEDQNDESDESVLDEDEDDGPCGQYAVGTIKDDGGTCGKYSHSTAKADDGPIEEYRELLYAYEGFYMRDFDAPIRIYGGVVFRCTESSSLEEDSSDDEVLRAANVCLKAYNEQLKKEKDDHDVDLKLRKVLRANYSDMGLGRMFYITMEAWDDKVYEAKVWESYEYEFEFMRPALYYPLVKDAYFTFDM